MNQQDKKEAKGLFRCQISNYIWDFGYYIDKRSIENHTLHLYSVDGKYFEMYYNSENHIVNICETGLEEISQFYGMEVPEILKQTPQFERKLSLLEI